MRPEAEVVAPAAEPPVTGRLFNIQRFSTEDGPGIRTTVFLKGCPLHCPWCANPESQLDIREIAHSDPLCDRCERCVPVCDRQAIRLDPAGGILIDRGRCDHCARCVEVCGPRALRVIGEDQTVDAVFEEVRKDEAYYRNSGGGVTCSGGEPLAQARFVQALFERCRDAGIHTALDTCAVGSARDLEALLACTDLVLLDLKLIDDAAHRAAVGCSNATILAHARLILGNGVPMIVRVPVVPGFTDSDDNIRGIAHFVRSLGAGIPVNVLPYHRFGTNKYAMLDRPYGLGDTKPPPGADVSRIVRCFESFGLPCEVVT